MKNLTPILIVLLFLVSCGGGNENSESKKEVRKAKPELVYLYGICIDSLDVNEDCVKKNEFWEPYYQEKV
jgi:hypothetical protein